MNPLPSEFTDDFIHATLPYTLDVNHVQCGGSTRYLSRKGILMHIQNGDFQALLSADVQMCHLRIAALSLSLPGTITPIYGREVTLNIIRPSPEQRALFDVLLDQVLKIQPGPLLTSQYEISISEIDRPIDNFSDLKGF